MKWFDRKFDFGLPVWMALNLLARLRGTPARIEELVHGLESGKLVARYDDAWSIQEQVGHLLDLESLWYGRVDDIFADVEVMRPADLKNRKTHEANHNARGIGELLAAFREDREKLVGRLEALESSDFERGARHPRLEQPMRLLDLMEFVAEHDDHHLAAISALLRFD